MDIIPKQMILDKFSSTDLYSIIYSLYQWPNIF